MDCKRCFKPKTHLSLWATKCLHNFFSRTWYSRNSSGSLQQHRRCSNSTDIQGDNEIWFRMYATSKAIINKINATWFYVLPPNNQCLCWTDISSTITKANYVSYWIIQRLALANQYFCTTKSIKANRYIFIENIQNTVTYTYT